MADDIGFHHANFWAAMKKQLGVQNPFMLDAYARTCSVLIANAASPALAKQIAMEAIGLWEVAENFGPLETRKEALKAFMYKAAEIESLLVILRNIEFGQQTQQNYVDSADIWNC